MHRLIALLAFLGACAAPPPRQGPERGDEKKTGDTRVVAFLNGIPVTWREVAEKAVELEFKRNVDLYVRWKILESRRAELGIANSPEELARRADAMIAHFKKSQGEEPFRRQLETEGYTEKTYRDFVIRNRLFGEKLTLEKMVRYSYFVEGWIETDRMLFAEEEDAKAFLARAKSDGYDKAVDFTKQAKGRITRRPREVFLRDLPPPDLDPSTVDRIFSLADGTLTGVERTRSGSSTIVLVRRRFSARKESYDSLRERLFAWILEEPPADAELAAWIDLQVKRSRVEYADRSSPRD